MLRTLLVLAGLGLLMTGCDNNQAPNEPNAATGVAPSASGGSHSSTAPSIQTANATTAPTTQSQTPPDRLYGTWVADDVDSKIGQVRIKLQFRREGPMDLLAWSELPLVGQVRDKTASYTATDDTLHSDAIRGGTTVQYHFNDQGGLVIEYQEGKLVTFHRAGAE